jgi:hypothetical protein
VDGKQFDSLVRSIERRANRRSMLKGLAGSGAAGLAAMGLSGRGDRLAAQDGTPEASPVAEEQHPSYLFVQLAEGGTWMAKPGEEGVFQLSLIAPSNQTLYFSDRPDRIVGTVATDTFLDQLGFTPFTPPNAAAVVHSRDGVRDALVVELFNPVYVRAFGEDDSDLLTYDARVLAAYEGNGLAPWVEMADDDQLPLEFSDMSLFIDDCPPIMLCYNQIRKFMAGPLPGRPYPQCWDPQYERCIDCDRSRHPIFFTSLCARTYPPACQYGECIGAW